MSQAIRANYRQRLLLPPSLEDWVPQGHPVRFVRDFVESLDVQALGFRESPGEEGRPHYATELLLGVWLYGWMERVRSSRALEKACLRDLGFLWLTGNHHPDHNTLWRFFRDHKQALCNLFKQVVQVAVKMDLVGFALHALDGTKMKAASSMEKAWHRKRLEKQLKRLDRWIEQGIAQIERSGQQEEPSYAMPESMQDAETRREAIRKKLTELAEAQTDHFHKGEPEARAMKMRRETSLGYNAQAVVDQQSDLIVGQDVSADETDHGQLLPMLETTKLTADRIAACTVADAGYYAGDQLSGAEKLGIKVIVRPQEDASTKGPYSKSQFCYDAKRDGYICPLGEFLPLDVLRQPTRSKPYRHVSYRCHNALCPVRSECSGSKTGRTINRTEHEEVLHRARQQFQDPDTRKLYRCRKEIVEHLFGIIKGIDGFRRFTVRGLLGVRTQWALACTAVNLRKLYQHWSIAPILFRLAIQ